MKTAHILEFIEFAKDYYQHFNGCPMEFEATDGTVYDYPACWKIYLDNEFEIKSDGNGFVNFGDVARSLMGQQCQYASRYFCRNWQDEYPYLGHELRITGTSANYHDMRIHKDDVAEAVKRYKNNHLTF